MKQGDKAKAVQTLERAVENEPSLTRAKAMLTELKGQRMRAVAGVLLGVVARLWLATLRLRVVVHPELDVHAATPWVLSFFHGTQWPLLAWRRRRPTLVMVSHSADGAMQARALGLLGLPCSCEARPPAAGRGGSR